MLGEKRTFLKESLGSIQDTGAIFPSSRWLARELTSPIYRSEKPLRILEVGAGTGPITCELVTQMRSKDSLTVVEINARMVETLKRRIAQLPNYEQQCDSIDIFVGPIQDLPETEKFDVIVCALPFNNFTADLCADILRKLQRLSHSETELTYFEYLGLRRLGRICLLYTSDAADDP